MREFATCEGTCRERKLELVSRADYDELAAAATVTRTRIAALRPVVEELAAPAAAPADSRVHYESMQGKARAALDQVRAPARACERAPASVQTRVVWRCPDCGGLEEMQPCIGVCIWRPAEWIEWEAFVSARARAQREVESERALFGVMAGFARVTPREGEWERNWRAFQARARRALGQ